jgi:hypothetical protein
VQFTSIPESNAENVIESSFGVQLPIADALQIGGASSLLKVRESQIIAIVGAQDAGKTSLLAGLYELFQDGPIGSTWYGGSNTLHAFERACHDARTASGRKTPYAERTGLGPVQFYHLVLRRDLDGATINLILSDRGGEMYEDATQDISNAFDFIEIKRAEKIVLLVDGAQLLEPRERHQAVNKTVMLAQALRDAGVLNPRTSIAIVLTKFDEIAHSTKCNEAMQLYQLLLARLSEVLNEQVADVRSFQIAASPKCSGYSMGFGLSELLDYWIGRTEFDISPYSGVQLVSSRIIDRFSYEA